MPESNKFPARGSFTSNVVIIFAAQIISRTQVTNPKAFRFYILKKAQLA